METIAWDYRASQHSPRGHPLEPLRETLASQGLPTAAAVLLQRAGAERLAAVTHLVVEHLWVPRLERRPAASRSRDFH